jgi:hypothetical protein
VRPLCVIDAAGTVHGAGQQAVSHAALGQGTQRRVPTRSPGTSASLCRKPRTSSRCRSLESMRCAHDPMVKRPAVRQRRVAQTRVPPGSPGDHCALGLQWPRSPPVSSHASWWRPVIWESCSREIRMESPRLSGKYPYGNGRRLQISDKVCRTENSGCVRGVHALPRHVGNHLVAGQDF